MLKKIFFCIKGHQSGIASHIQLQTISEIFITHEKWERYEQLQK